MHSKVYAVFESILRRYPVQGNVLEVGAAPNQRMLLSSQHLAGVSRKVGINLSDPGRHEGIDFVRGSANHMDMFENGQFDCVLCNAVLEHDKYFWKSLAEMRRVLRSGGLMVIGTPSYIDQPWAKYTRKMKNDSFLKDFIRNFTFCYRLHPEPGDYYRFSEQAYNEVFFEGFNDVVVQTVMVPPRTIGYGIKPSN